MLMKNSNIFQKVWHLLISFGPGLFCIGYTLGTGSVTSMVKSGSDYGCQMLWVLFLSCLFSWVLMEAYGRYAVVSGDTAIHGIRTRFKFGRPLACIVAFGVILGQWSCLSGILSITSHAIGELIGMFVPGVGSSYWLTLLIAVAIICVMYFILIKGDYSFFEKFLVVLVTIMGLSFLVSMFIVLPPLSEIASGMIPVMPDSPGAKLMIAAFVGTTMAAPTCVVRPLLLKEKGWDMGDLRRQTKDSAFSALLMFVISASIMITATGVLFADGKTIDKVLDMVYVLEPVAGRFAVALFIVGLMSAGLSSIFPILMVAPLMVSDYRNGEMNTRTPYFKYITAIAAIVGLTIPVLGFNPIVSQVATQVANVFVLPLVAGLIIILVNRRDIMGDNKAGMLLNIGMSCAFVFSCIIAYTGVLALIDLVK